MDDSDGDHPEPASGWVHRLIEPRYLFTAIALALLAIIWGVAISLVQREFELADEAAAALAADIADTYEAQVVRALREIDQTLRLVRFELQGSSPQEALTALGAENLLPPSLLFTIGVADAHGEILASTNPEFGDNVASRDFFNRARDQEGLIVGQPRLDAGSNEWRLSFVRRLLDKDGRFGGIVVVTTYASYFVSGYDPAALGDHGVLGLVGVDGVFRVRRTGNAIHAGTEIEFDAVLANDGTQAQPVPLFENPWDGVLRYTIVRKLFQFPLAVVVALSREEQLAPAAERRSVYFRRAGAASLGVIAIMALLGRLSSQLNKARSRVMEERVAHAERVEYMAFHDSLTDLPNRAFFNHLLTRSIHHARRYGNRTALMFLDLDRFKAVNDTLGHDIGDELLQQVAQRLTDTLRESDIVARLGGDEFVVLLPVLDEPLQAAPVAEKVLSTVGKPFNLAGHEFRITVSVGIAIYPDDGEDEQTLIKNADIAMYSAKESGKNNFKFYSEELTSDSLERLALETSMRNALRRNEFRLFYQAKRDLLSGKLTGMEALLRWDHPDLGLVQPMQFIPIAEENGLIVPIGRWVLKTACQQNVEWQQQGLPRLSIAVNLSARQFLDNDLFNDVNQALEESGMAPELLELEITESMIMHDIQKTADILTRLRQMGIRIAIDDFGTGYSSLSTLKLFPLDTIKIDGSFVQDVASNAEDRGLTDAVISVGKSLGLTVVAEGVESEHQEAFLRTHHCDQFQGFYINKPMPAEEFSRVLGDSMERDD